MFNRYWGILLVAVMIFGISNSEAKFMNRFKDGFYFEKYKTAEEAKAALLELHPIGSNVDDLVKTLEKAGAVVYKDHYIRYINNEKKRIENKNNVSSYYEHRIFTSIFPNSWSIYMKYKENEIESIKVQLYQGA